MDPAEEVAKRKERAKRFNLPVPTTKEEVRVALACVASGSICCAWRLETRTQKVSTSLPSNGHSRTLVSGSTSFTASLTRQMYACHCILMQQCSMRRTPPASPMQHPACLLLCTHAAVLCAANDVAGGTARPCAGCGTWRMYDTLSSDCSLHVFAHAALGSRTITRSS